MWFAQVTWKQADNAAKREACLARHPERRRGRSRPRYQVNMLGLTRGESSRITPWAPPVMTAQWYPPKPKRAPSQRNEE